MSYNGSVKWERALSPNKVCSNANHREIDMAYTDKEVAVLENAANENGSVTFEMAEQLGVELGKSTRSIVSKLKQLELPYTKKEKAPKREKGMTKAELVAQIAVNLGADADEFDGLSKATAKALGRLVELT